MLTIASNYWKFMGVAGALAGLLVWPVTGAAQLLTDTTQTLTSTAETLTTSTITATQTVTGQAAAVRATVLDLLGGGTTTVLADTGTLGDTADARDASQLFGSVPSLLVGEVLHATTIGWPDQVASEVSLAGLGLTVGGTTISADFIMAEATALLGAAGSGTSLLDNLSINGVPVSVNSNPNQVYYIPGGRVVINEQQSSPGSMVVNALHVIVSGVADVVVGSATAGIQ